VLPFLEVDGEDIIFPCNLPATTAYVTAVVAFATEVNFKNSRQAGRQAGCNLHWFFDVSTAASAAEPCKEARFSKV
jgi:hypothetical protein